MTISSTINRKTWQGNGVTTAFSFPYKFLANEDLVLTLTKADGTQVVWTLGTDYTVSGAGNANGGTITATVAPATGQSLTAVDDPALTQGVDLVPNDPFPADTLEGALDRLTLIGQAARDKVNRAPVLRPADSDGSGAYDFKGNRATNAADPQTDSDLVTRGWANGQYLSGAQTAAGQAQTSASNAATSASQAATSASNAHTSEVNAGNSASQAATSASNAQAAASSIGFRNVKFLTYANSPYTVQAADSGYLISVDTSGGNVVVNLPAIGSLTLPYSIGFKKSTSDVNTLTVNCGGTDKFDSGSTSKALSTGGAGTTLIPEANTTPDEWVASDWGAMGGQQKKQQFVAGTDFTAGSTSSLTVSQSPLPASAQSLEIYFDAAYQQGSEWSYNPTTGVITFNSAIPPGVQKIETRWSTPLVVGAPADGTVTGAKIASGDAANIRSQIGVTQATETNVGIAGVATQATTNAGTDDATIVTPKKLRFGVSMNLAQNGYLFLPSWLGGLGIQWGYVSAANSTSTQTVPFPVAFPNACLNVITQISETGDAGTNYASGYYTVSGMAKANFTTSYTTSRYWIAIGY